MHWRVHEPAWSWRTASCLLSATACAIYVQLLCPEDVTGDRADMCFPRWQNSLEYNCLTDVVMPLQFRNYFHLCTDAVEIFLCSSGRPTFFGEKLPAPGYTSIVGGRTADIRSWWLYSDVMNSLSAEIPCSHFYLFETKNQNKQLSRGG
jgi:hypothetical protein